MADTRRSGRQSARPRILMVSASAFPMIGGLETHISEVGPRITRAGYQVTLLTTDLSGSLPGHEQRDGVEIMRVRAWPAERDFYFAPGIYGAMQRGHWDLVHCQGYHTLTPPIAMLAASRARLPYVVTFHSGGNDSPAWLRAIQQAALRPLLARAKTLIAVSDWERKKMSRQLRLRGDRFLTIPNGAAMTAPAPARAKEDDSLIVSVGRLERYKGHQYAIAALPHLLAQLPKARLRIVGSGPFEPELQRLAHFHGVSDRVEIRGVDGRNRSGMAKILTQAGLVVALSEYESQGIAAMEALALGRRLLVADNTALGDLSARGWAVGVSPYAPATDIASAMLKALRSTPPRNLELPSWDECANRLVEVYRRVLGHD